MTGSRLSRLLRPKSLAFVGGAAAERAVDACRSMGFDGEMWGVNPRRRLRDLPTATSVSELPTVVDAAFVGVSRHAAVSVVKELAALGAGAAVCYASGFAESGPKGAALQRELAAAAAGMPLVGPNCYGTLSAVTGAALWPDLHGLTRCERGVALISQSGNIAVNLTMQRRGLSVAHVVTVGNQADVGLSEAFEALAADESVTGVGLYAEEIDDIGRFAAACAKARRRRLPVAILKAGASQASRAIAVTHTGSMAGSDAAYDALFRRLGARRVRTVSELLDTLAVLCTVGPLPGRRLVSLSCSGGEAALMADRARDYDVSFPLFAADHRRCVEASLDGRVTAVNPFDYHTFIWGDEARLTECFNTVLRGGLGSDGPKRPSDAARDRSKPEQSPPIPACGAKRPFDAAVLVLDFPADGLDRSRWQPTLTAFGSACAASGTPGVLVASMAENLPAEARARAAELGLTSCVGFDNALVSLEAAALFGRTLANSGRVSEPLMPPAEGCRPPVSSATGPSAGRGLVTLPEHEAKALLAAAGVAVPQGRVVSSASDAVAAAAEIRRPVVVKAGGLDHKSDSSGVAVGLDTSAAVVAAAGRLGAVGDGSVLVEAFVSDAVAELMVSVRSSPPVGMLLTLGAGGTLVEVLNDTASLLLPASGREVRSALRSLRLWPLLEGHRDRPPAALNAVVATVAALTSLVRDNRGITEVEINPLLATSNSAVAVDALIVAASPARGVPTDAASTAHNPRAQSAAALPGR